MARYLIQTFALLVMLGVGASWGMQSAEEKMQNKQGLAGSPRFVTWPPPPPDPVPTVEALSLAADTAPSVWIQWGNQFGEWLQGGVRACFAQVAEVVHMLLAT